MVTVGFSLFMVGRCKKFNNNHIEVAQHWENHFRWALNRFNSIYKDEIECCTPHVARHTFCSNMASLGMAPKTLQTIMGHSSIGVTMDVYTHVEARDVQKDFRELMKNKQYSVYPLDGEPDIVVFGDDEEFQAKLQQKRPAKAKGVDEYIDGVLNNDRRSLDNNEYEKKRDLLFGVANKAEEESLY